MLYLKKYESFDFEEDFEETPTFDIENYINKWDMGSEEPYHYIVIRIGEEFWDEFVNLAKSYGYCWYNGTSLDDFIPTSYFDKSDERYYYYIYLVRYRNQEGDIRMKFTHSSWHCIKSIVDYK